MAVRRVPQQDRSIETQRAVLEGAAAVFHRVGYGNASLSMIAEESGVSQGSMYFHFKSKEQIALAVINEQHARSLPVLHADPSPSASVFEHLVRVSRGVAEQLREDTVVQAGIRLALEEDSLQEESAGFYEAWVASTAELLEHAVTEGEIVSSLPVAALARTMIGYFTGVQLMSRATSGRADLFAVLVQMWVVLTDALIPEERRKTALAVVGEVFAA